MIYSLAWDPWGFVGAVIVTLVLGVGVYWIVSSPSSNCDTVDVDRLRKREVCP
jgi:hypothetical protein